MSHPAEVVGKPERWQITGLQAVYATADEALAALQKEVDEDETAA